MKEWLIKATFFACVILVSIAGNAQTAMSLDSQQNRIVSLENAWNQAALQKDTRAMNHLLSDELIYIDYDGKVMNKGEYLATILLPDAHFEHIASNSMQVQFFGQAAVVIGIYVEKGIRNGKPFSHRERFVDTWIAQNNAWMCVASQSTLITP